MRIINFYKLKGGALMKRCVIIISCIIALTVGCTSKRGIIELTTRPEGAKVYLNRVKQGVTPVEFEYDFRQPKTLRIEKDGYYSEKESLNETWVVREYQKGNYMEGRFTIQGGRKKAWKVSTMRRLQKKEKE